MLIMMKKIISFVFFCCLASCVWGQDSILDDYIAVGLKNNQQFLRERLATTLQYQVEQEARGKYMPDIFLDASYSWADGGRTIDVPAGDLVNPAYEGTE